MDKKMDKKIENSELNEGLSQEDLDEIAGGKGELKKGSAALMSSLMLLSGAPGLSAYDNKARTGSTQTISTDNSTSNKTGKLDGLKEKFQEKFKNILSKEKFQEIFKKGNLQKIFTKENLKKYGIPAGMIGGGAVSAATLYKIFNSNSEPSILELLDKYPNCTVADCIYIFFNDYSSYIKETKMDKTKNNIATLRSTLVSRVQKEDPSLKEKIEAVLNLKAGEASQIIKPKATNSPLSIMIYHILCDYTFSMLNQDPNQDYLNYLQTFDLNKIQNSKKTNEHSDVEKKDRTNDNEVAPREIEKEEVDESGDDTEVVQAENKDGFREEYGSEEEEKERNKGTYDSDSDYESDDDAEVVQVESGNEVEVAPREGEKEEVENATEHPSSITNSSELDSELAKSVEVPLDEKVKTEAKTSEQDENTVPEEKKPEIKELAQIEGQRAEEKTEVQDPEPAPQIEVSQTKDEKIKNAIAALQNVIKKFKFHRSVSLKDLISYNIKKILPGLKMTNKEVSGAIEKHDLGQYFEYNMRMLSDKNHTKERRQLNENLEKIFNHIIEQNEKK